MTVLTKAEMLAGIFDAPETAERLKTAMGISIERAIGNIRQRTYCVTDFGAKGDGIADDTVAIMLAIATAAMLGGGGILFPAGRYLVNTGTTFLQHANRNIFLYSDAPGGAAIVNGAARPAYQWGNADPAQIIYGGGVRGLTFINAAGINGGTGVVVQNVGQFTVENCKFFNGPGTPYGGARFTGCSQFKVFGNEAQSCTVGFEFKACIDGYLVSNRSDSNSYLGYLLNGSQGMYALNCSAYFNGGSAWRLTSDNPATLPNMNNFFTHCIGDTSGGVNWIIEDSINSWWTACWGSTQKDPALNTFATGFYLTGRYTFSLTFNACGALFNNSHGMWLYDPGGNAPSNIHIRGCIFGSQGFAGANGNGRSGDGYGIAINGAVDHIRVNGGQLLLNASGAIGNTSSGTDIIIDGNPVGYRTSNQGVAAIATGSSSVVIPHGLGFTPSLANISLTDNASRTAASIASLWVSDVTAATFKVNADANVSQAFNFAWAARGSGT